jgi:hypothetical protein
MHPLYHLQHLISTTPLHTTRPEPYRTHQHLAHAELVTPARKTIANSYAPNTSTPTPSPTATTDTSNATSTPTLLASTCANTPSTPCPSTSPTASPLTAPSSRTRATPSQVPTGHPTPQAPRSRADCLEHMLHEGRLARQRPQRPLRQPRLAPLRNSGLDCQPAAGACVAQRGRTHGATAAVRRRRAGRHPSVGHAGCAEHGLLGAHAQGLAQGRPAALKG